MAKSEKLSPEELAAAIAAQPLVGVKRASSIIGVAAPNFGRHRARLTEIPVEGSSSVFVKSEVEALAGELRESREARR